MQNLKAIVEAYTDAYGSTDSWVSSQIGMSRAALSAWWTRGLSQMPSPHQLYLLARATRTPYRDVLDAALTDFGYLPESAAAHSEPPPRMNRRADQKAGDGNDRSAAPIVTEQPPIVPDETSPEESD